jgi:hypothetical protein
VPRARAPFRSPAAPQPRSPAAPQPACTGDLEAAIGRAALRIATLTRLAPLQLAIAIGRAVAEELYGGDLVRLRGAWRRGDPSYRRLAAQPALGVGPSELHRCVAVYELLERLRVPASEQAELSKSHFVAIALAPRSAQQALLERARASVWGVERTEREARALRRRTPGGRPPLHPTIRALHRFEALLRREEPALREGAGLPPLGPAERDRSLAVCEEMVELGRRLGDQLRRERSGLADRPGTEPPRREPASPSP